VEYKHTLNEQVLKTVKQSLVSLGIDSKKNRLLVACSMGIDSATLLHALCILRESLHFELYAVYLNHGFRPEANQEGDHFLSYCKTLHVQGQVVRLTITQGSLQQEARKSRYDALVSIANKLNCNWIVTGHTRSDQAETVLMRLLMGAGPKGLGGIPQKTQWDPNQNQQSGTLIARPMLSISRQSIVYYAQKHSVPYLNDPTNQKDCFFRNRIRHNILPLLKKEDPQIENHLANLATTMSHESDYLQQLAKEKLALYKSMQKERLLENPNAVDRTFLTQLHPGLFPYVVMELSPVTLSHKQIYQLNDLLQNQHGEKSIILSNNYIAKRRYNWFFFEPMQRDLNKKPQVNTLTEYCVIEGPGSYRFEGGILCVEATEHPTVNTDKDNPHLRFLSGQNAFPWIFRKKKQGDLIKLSFGRKKVSDWLIDTKVPSSRRHNTLVLEKDSDLLWVVGISPRYFNQEEPIVWKCTFQWEVQS